MEKVELFPPWIIFVNKLEAMFEKDDEINIVYNDNNKEVRLYVDNPSKAEALAELLPAEKTFGNVVLEIEVIPNNDEITDIDLFRRAFEGNEAVAYIDTIEALGAAWNYVVFEPEVVQYHNDDIKDINGLCSTLYENIARDIFDTEEVFFCTDEM